MDGNPMKTVQHCVFYFINTDWICKQEKIGIWHDLNIKSSAVGIWLVVATGKQIWHRTVDISDLKSIHNWTHWTIFRCQPCSQEDARDLTSSHLRSTVTEVDWDYIYIYIYTHFGYSDHLFLGMKVAACLKSAASLHHPVSGNGNNVHHDYIWNQTPSGNQTWQSEHPPINWRVLMGIR